MKVLILEDNQNYADSLLDEFSSKNITCKHVSSVNELFSETSNYSHLLLDIRLQDESSLDSLEQIRIKFPESKIFILTGYGSISSTVKAVKLGADDYFTKPISFPVLFAAMTGDNEQVIETIKDDNFSLNRNEREYIEYVLEKCEGNISKAAKVLGLHRQSLQRKLRKYSTS